MSTFLVGLMLGVLLERLRLWVYGPDPEDQEEPPPLPWERR